MKGVSKGRGKGAEGYIPPGPEKTMNITFTS